MKVPIPMPRLSISGIGSNLSPSEYLYSKDEHKMVRYSPMKYFKPGY